MAIMPTVPFKVKAIFEYGSPHDDDLSFPDGQIITVTAEEDDEWYAGEFVDSAGEKHEGIFPRNFVEKYEPEIPLRPARPVRPKKDAEAATPAPMASTTESAPTEAAAATGEHKVLSERPIESDSPRLGARASPPSIQSSSRQPASATPAKSLEQTQQKQASKDVPTQLPERSGTGSFKDRIAAFNKAAAPPIAPFKPGGQGTSGSAGFIKKPFVAPPPSKNAYMPPQREPPPTKVYRREEDPALNEAADDSESSMPLLGDKAETPGEEQSKPTSLKDRIALLQKQQLEQAARHAEAAQKKEKPKKPPKKQTDPQEAVQATEAAAEADPDRLGDTAGKKSVDFADDDSESLGGDGGRQAPNIAYMATPPPPSRELMSDTNDADYSAGGDTEEAEDTSTSKEDDHEKGRRLGGISKHADAPAGEVEAEASDEDADQEEEVDPEIRRRMEIRERMAKMSGGMGLMGMFGPPGSMPMPVKKGRASGDAERDVSGNHEKDEAVERAAPVPVPGMSNIGSLKRKPNQAEVNDSTDEDSVQTPSQQLETTEAERSGETIELPRPPPRSSMDHGPPPIPQGKATH